MECQTQNATNGAAGRQKERKWDDGKFLEPWWALTIKRKWLGRGPPGVKASVSSYPLPSLLQALCPLNSNQLPSQAVTWGLSPRYRKSRGSSREPFLYSQGEDSPQIRMQMCPQEPTWDVSHPQIPRGIPSSPKSTGKSYRHSPQPRRHPRKKSSPFSSQSGRALGDALEEQLWTRCYFYVTNTSPKCLCPKRS